MAKKTKKNIEKNIEDFFKWKWRCLQRRPEYKQDYAKWVELNTKLSNFINSDEDPSASEISETKRLIEEINKIQEKYGTLDLPDPNDNDKVGGIFLRAGTSHGNVSVRWLGWPLESPKDDYRDFKVNIWGKKGIILHEISQLIDYERKNAKRNYSVIQKFHKSPHLRNSDRYFKVFDLRNKKPPMTYRNIAASLVKDGQCKNTDLDKVENLAKKDFGVAFKEIYDIPYKRHGKSMLKKSDSKACSECPKHSQCNDMCADLLYEMELIEVKQQHKLLRKGEMNMLA